jgi:hypothetical protein
VEDEDEDAEVGGTLESISMVGCLQPPSANPHLSPPSRIGIAMALLLGLSLRSPRRDVDAAIDVDVDDEADDEADVDIPTHMY